MSPLKTRTWPWLLEAYAWAVGTCPLHSVLLENDSQQREAVLGGHRWFLVCTCAPVCVQGTASPVMAGGKVPKPSWHWMC